MSENKNYLNLDLEANVITLVDRQKITLPLRETAVVAIQMPYNKVPERMKINDPTDISDIIEYGGRLLIGTAHCCRGSLYEYYENGTPDKINTAPTNVFDILPVVMKREPQSDCPVPPRQLLIAGYGCDGRGVFLYDGTNYTKIADREAIVGTRIGFTVTDGGVFCGNLRTHPYKTVSKHNGDQIWYNMGEFSKLQHNSGQANLTSKLDGLGVNLEETLKFVPTINKVRQIYNL